MSKRILFQINVPNYGPENASKAFGFIKDMYEISEKNARKYAKKFGADYYKVEKEDDFKPTAHKHLDYQKLKAYDFSDYDQVIYMDCDYIIKDNAPDLFELCKNKFSVCLDTGKRSSEYAELLGIPKEKYFNAGFMYIPGSFLRQSKPYLEKYLDKEYGWHGQGLMNILANDFNVDLNLLDPIDWNHTGRTFGTYADHYAGAKKKRFKTTNYDS